MLSSRVCLASTRRARLRMAAKSAKCCSKRSTAPCAAASNCATFAPRAASFGCRASAASLRFSTSRSLVQRLDELLAALRVVQQIVLQEWIAFDDPDIPQDFVQHPGGAAGPPFTAQLIEQVPSGGAQQTDDD